MKADDESLLLIAEYVQRVIIQEYHISGVQLVDDWLAAQSPASRRLIERYRLLSHTTPVHLNPWSALRSH